MQLFLYRKSRNGLFGSSRDASVPDLRFRKSEKIPSSNFFEFLTGRPNAWKRKDRHRTMSVPEIWKRLFLLSISLQLSLSKFLDQLTIGHTIHILQSVEETFGSKNRGSNRWERISGNILMFYIVSV